MGEGREPERARLGKANKTFGKIAVSSIGILILIGVLIMVFQEDDTDSISDEGRAERSAEATQVAEFIDKEGQLLFGVLNAQAGSEVAQTMLAEGRAFNEEFVQEGVFRIKQGDPNQWLIRREDVVGACGVFERLNIGLTDSGPGGRDAVFDRVLGDFDDGLVATIFGIIIGAEPSNQALNNYCATAGL